VVHVLIVLTNAEKSVISKFCNEEFEATYKKGIEPRDYLANN